jgi:hypothetical protein
VTGLAAGSSHPPTTDGSFQPSPGGGLDAFVAKLTSAGALEYLSYLGGTEHEQGSSMGFDPDNRAWLAGVSFSRDFPRVGGTGGNEMDCPLCGNAFTTQVDPSGESLVWSDTWGGSLDDTASGVGGCGSWVGHTYSPDFRYLVSEGGLYSDGLWSTSGAPCTP